MAVTPAPAVIDYETLYRQVIVANQVRDEQLALLAHELRNPLNALSTSSEVLRRSVPGSVPAVSATSVIARQVRKLADLIDLRLPRPALRSGPGGDTEAKAPAEPDAVSGSPGTVASAR